MKILLATPPKPDIKHEWENFYPKTGLLYLASYAKRYLPVDHHFRYLEGSKHNLRQYINLVKKYDPDVFAISFVTLSSRVAYRAIDAIKNELEHVTIICGGPHPTVSPYEVLKFSKADICVIGEGEETFKELLSTTDNCGKGLNRIPGIAFRNNGDIHLTEPRHLIKNLDIVPFPAWDLIDFADYSGYHWKRASPDMCIVSSRGCPYNCVFCSNPVWKYRKPWLRLRSPENIAEEIKLLHNKFGVREIFDFSDEFNSSLKWSMAVCDEIKKLGIDDLFFKCQLRADNITDEFAKLLRDIGYWLVNIGIESGNQRTLNGIDKRITLQQVVRSCRKLKKEGIKILGFFMIFNVWEENGTLKFETPEMCRNTLRFAQRLISEKLIDYISWSIATPMPGSRMFDIARKHDLLRVEEGFSEYDMDHVVMTIPNVRDRDIKRIKLQGMLLQAKSSLLRGNLNIRNYPHMLKKVLSLLSNIR